MGMDGFRETRGLPSRNQAHSSRSRRRKRTVRSASSLEMRRRGGDWLRGILRALPRLIYLSLLILAGWLLYYSFNSPYFAVREITVSGNRLLSADGPRNVAGAQGSNLLLLRADGIEQSIRSIAAVREARVVLALPGRIEIGIVERTPLVQWQSREASFLVDGDGVAFSQELPADPVPVVVDVDGPALELGSRVDPAVLATVRTLQSALLAQVGTEFWRFDYSRSSGVVVPTGDDMQIVFGDAGDLEAKLASLAAVQEHLKSTQTRAKTIDLRFKGRPAYILAASSEEDGQTQEQTASVTPDSR